MQNKLPTMEALEAEVTKSGQDYEDFKGQIRDQLLTQELIRKEVGSKIIVSHEDVVKYYNEHKTEFVRPETVVLREIFVSTEGKPEADIPALRKKADRFARPCPEQRRRFWANGQALFGQHDGAAVGRTRHLPALAARPEDRGKGIRPQSQPDDGCDRNENRISRFCRSTNATRRASSLWTKSSRKSAIDSTNRKWNRACARIWRRCGKTATFRSSRGIPTPLP